MGGEISHRAKSNQKERPRVTGRLSLKSSPGVFKGKGGREEGEVVGPCCQARAMGCCTCTGCQNWFRVQQLPVLYWHLGLQSFIASSVAFSQLSCNFSLIVPRRSELPAGFKCLKGRAKVPFSFVTFYSDEQQNICIMFYSLQMAFCASAHLFLPITIPVLFLHGQGSVHT